MLSRYRIGEKLGAGGMGVVYRAEDISLKRPVALKFLSGTALSQEQTRARFLREAQTAAALNHPNVCTIHEIGEVQKGEEEALGTGERVEAVTPFIAMELIEGRTLEAIVRQSGSLPCDDLLQIALQISEGMAAAHARGIVHRDLKPGNVMVTKDGRVKILDFGLAKPLEPAEPGDAAGTAAATASAELTREGRVIGTAAYMSPEQAKGEHVDSRSDIFSFGVMLYELATGTRPFRGTTTISTLAKIIEAEPEPIPETRVDIPQELRRIVRRCLQKKPEDRYNDTRDLVAALKALRQETTSGAPKMANAAAGAVPARSAHRRKVFWAASAVGLLVVAAALILLARQPTALRPGGGVPVHRQITFTTTAEAPDLSPDGKTVVFVEDVYGREPRLLVQDLATGEPHEIHRGSVEVARWSPDGSRILCVERDAKRGRSLLILPRLGGSGSRVDVPLLGSRWYAAWAPDGQRVAVACQGGNKIAIVDVVTGRSETLSAGSDVRFIVDLDWSRRADLLCVCVQAETERQIRVVPLRGSIAIVFREPVSGFGWLARWAPSGDAIYYLRGSGGTTLDLWKVLVDPATGRATGKSTAILAGIPLSNGVSLSADGTRLAYGRAETTSNLWLVEVGAGLQREAVRARPLTTGAARVERPRISPDGQRVAYASGTEVTASIWTMDLEGGRPQQLTFLEGFNSAPAWSPDGTRIAFASSRGEAHRIQVVSADGGTPTSLPGTPWSTGPVTAWEPGNVVLWHCRDNQDFCLRDLDKDEERLLLGGARNGWVFHPAPAPDGRRLAFYWNRPDGPGVWVASLDGGDPQPLTRKPLWPLGWSQDGRFVFAVDIDASPHRVVRIAAVSRSEERLFELPFDVDPVDPGTSHPTGTRFVFTRVDRKSDIWVTENFDPGQ